MPLTFSVDPAARLLHVRCTGEITFDQIIEYEVQVVQDPEFDPTYSELFDLREAVKLDVSSSEVQDLIDYEATQEKYAGTRKQAFVAPSDLSYGITRMYGMMEDKSPMETQVFRDMDEARRWLGLVPSP